MRKKIYSVALACVLTMSLGITAFAGTSSRGGVPAEVQVEC